MQCSKALHFFFFFQAEDGIRDHCVTGVQTCALPISKDNTPAVVSMELVPGKTIEVDVAAKGGGSEAKAKFAMLNPSDSVVDWVLKTVPTMGAGWCPPGMLGIGIGGTAEKAMQMA